MANLFDGFSALADPTRRKIFERLADKCLAVGELAEELPVSRPAVSQHLKVLKEAGLVSERQEGTRRRYAVEPWGVEDMRAYLTRLRERALAAAKAREHRPVVNRKIDLSWD